VGACGVTPLRSISAREPHPASAAVRFTNAWGSQRLPTMLFGPLDRLSYLPSPTVSDRFPTVDAFHPFDLDNDGGRIYLRLKENAMHFLGGLLLVIVIFWLATRVAGPDL
jgi:hypothetical protein